MIKTYLIRVGKGASDDLSHSYTRMVVFLWLIIIFTYDNITWCDAFVASMNTVVLIVNNVVTRLMTILFVYFLQHKVKI